MNLTAQFAAGIGCGVQVDVGRSASDLSDEGIQRGIGVPQGTNDIASTDTPKDEASTEGLQRQHDGTILSQWCQVQVSCSEIAAQAIGKGKVNQRFSRFIEQEEGPSRGIPGHRWAWKLKRRAKIRGEEDGSCLVE